ncbi:MAG: Arc family DNA binding domain-containing protein [Verrucomicrobia bacterium]|nr:Arc family DNA binding domain-containing protein [Verrucomicrobiota bacterium]MCF7708308.1 Arc family DNA binding domain-containing protein [Verrucomicrobiota bacterium]
MSRRKQFLLRIDPRLWEEIESWAQQELRSVNGQIEYLLRQAVIRRKKKSAGEGGADEDRGSSEQDFEV